MGYRCMVSLNSLDRLMYLVDHWCWKRVRASFHAGAVRDFARPYYEVNLDPQGPEGKPMPCDYCDNIKNINRSSSSGYWSDSST
jgi:hypothetical protein